MLYHPICIYIILCTQVVEEINLNSCSGYRCCNRPCNSVSAIWESPTTYQLSLHVLEPQQRRWTYAGSPVSTILDGYYVSSRIIPISDHGVRVYNQLSSLHPTSEPGPVGARLRRRDKKKKGRRIKRKSCRDIPLNNPINLIRFPTSFPNFSNYYIRIYPLSE